VGGELNQEEVKTEKQIPSENVGKKTKRIPKRQCKRNTQNKSAGGERPKPFAKHFASCI
jgi:hypothetical protein